METPESVVARAAAAGADVALSMFRTTLSVEQKTSQVDLVTEADRAAQNRVIEVIREHDPESTIVAEEDDAAKSLPDEGRAWVVDPIDGTTNFVHGLRVWATSVALVEDGETLAAANVAPALGDHYVARDGVTMRNDEQMSVTQTDDIAGFVAGSTLRVESKDAEQFGALARAAADRFGEFRRIGSAQVTLSMVASGELDAVFAAMEHPNPWDTIAGVHQIRCAGGVVTDLAGDPWQPDATGLVGSNGETHEELLTVVRDAVEGYRE